MEMAKKIVELEVECKHLKEDNIKFKMENERKKKKVMELKQRSSSEVSNLKEACMKLEMHNKRLEIENVLSAQVLGKNEFLELDRKLESDHMITKQKDRLLELEQKIAVLEMEKEGLTAQVLNLQKENKDESEKILKKELLEMELVQDKIPDLVKKVEKAEKAKQRVQSRLCKEEKEVKTMHKITQLRKKVLEVQKLLIEKMGYEEEKGVMEAKIVKLNAEVERQKIEAEVSKKKFEENVRIRQQNMVLKGQVEQLSKDLEDMHEASKELCKEIAKLKAWNREKDRVMIKMEHTS